MINLPNIPDVHWLNKIYGTKKLQRVEIDHKFMNDVIIQRNAGLTEVLIAKELGEPKEDVHLYLQIIASLESEEHDKKMDINSFNEFEELYKRIYPQYREECENASHIR